MTDAFKAMRTEQDYPVSAKHLTCDCLSRVLLMQSLSFFYPSPPEKTATFCDSSTGFLMKLGLRNEQRNFIPMTTQIRSST